MNTATDRVLTVKITARQSDVLWSVLPADHLGLTVLDTRVKGTREQLDQARRLVDESVLNPLDRRSNEVVRRLGERIRRALILDS